MKWRLKLFVLAVWLGAHAVQAEDRIWLKANINGKFANLCFDTGAACDFLFSDGAARLDVPVESNNIPTRVNGESVPLRKSKEFRLEMFGQLVRVSFPVIDTPELGGPEADGVVGWPTLKGNLMRIEANHGAMVILKQLPLDIAKWTRLEIDTNSNLLRLVVPNHRESPSLVFIDTGDEGGVSLPSVRWQEWRSAHTKDPMTLRGYFTPGIGLVVAEEGWAREISVGSVLMNDVPITKFDKADDYCGSYASVGKLGMAALRQLDFIIDGKNHVAYLRTKETPAAEYTHNRLGAIFSPPGRAAHVIQGSPAWEAGIRDGDVLCRIGNQDITQWGTDPTLTVNNNWEMAPGTRFKLTLRRGTNDFTAEVVLKEILHSEKTSSVSEAGTRF